MQGKIEGVLITSREVHTLQTLFDMLGMLQTSNPSAITLTSSQLELKLSQLSDNIQVSGCFEGEQNHLLDTFSLALEADGITHQIQLLDQENAVVKSYQSN